MSFIWRVIRSFSAVGVVVGLALFCVSLTPSLLPREFVVQGVLSGVVFAAGYGIGWAGHRIWRFLELRDATGSLALTLTAIPLSILTITVIYTLNRATIWQNSVRLQMEMEPIHSTYPIHQLLVSIATALLVILLTRLLLFTATKFVNAINHYLPPRISTVLGGTVFVLMLISFVDGLILKAALRTMDEAFSEANRLLDDEYVQPQKDEASGSAKSLISWGDIGRNGKKFVADGPTKEAIRALLGREAMQPIRVYAGFDTGDSLEERSQIALAELKRVGGFNRSTLIVATPTGTGWLDPSAVDTIEFIQSGDVATVALQYSYLPSWLTLMIAPDRSKLAAKALFKSVYGYWATLSPDKRPALYLHGLSLGALGSESSNDLITMIADPINGALWSGPPFPSEDWKTITQSRNKGSPEWRPIFRNSASIRFMTQDGFADLGKAKWGPLRIVYLQHASDPMSFFSPDLAYSRPAWLSQDRGRDVSPYLSWFPIVTFFQIGFDLPMATSVSLGYGHNFAPASYIDAWIEVTQPKNWNAADTEKLKNHFADFNPSP